MFFFFSKVLFVFSTPLGFSIFWGVFLSLVAIRRYKTPKWILFPWLLLWAISTYPVSQKLMTSLEDNFPPKSLEEVQYADAIVILGGMINTIAPHKNRVEFLSSVERVLDGLQLYKNKKAKYLLFSGGSGVLGNQEMKEADLFWKFAKDQDVDLRWVLLEKESRNTHENAQFSKKVFEEKKIGSIILITSAFHIQRSLEEFQKLDVKVEAFPTDYRALDSKNFYWDQYLPTIGSLENSTIAIKEWIGILAYKLILQIVP